MTLKHIWKSWLTGKGKLLSSFLGIYLFHTGLAHAQLDNQHWLPPFYSTNINVPEEQYLYLSTPSPDPITVRIQDGACENLIEEVVISNDQPLRYNIGANETRMITGNDQNILQPLNDMGYCLQSDGLFFANVRMQNANQGGSLTSKGVEGAGTVFRVGKLWEVEEFYTEGNRSNFVSIMALEDGTQIRISDMPANTKFANGFIGGEVLATLNKGESFIAGIDLLDPTVSIESRNALMGALVESLNGQPIVLSCGSYLGGNRAATGQDVGIDQPVPADKVGEEYILVKGDGNEEQETPIVIAHEDNTQVFINGNNVPEITLNGGEYYRVPEAFYGGARGNMYIRTSNPSYIYQMLASDESNANVSLNFIPPINCFQPSSVNNIPDVDRIGDVLYLGGMLVVALTGSAVEVTDGNGLVDLPAPQLVPGKEDFSTYRIENLTGDVRIESEGALQVGIFGENNAVGWSGYYAGFPRTKPILSQLALGDVCANGGVLSVLGGGYDTYEWYKEGEFLLVETIGSLNTGPYGAGSYSVRGILDGCGISEFSDALVVDCEEADICSSAKPTLWVKPESQIIQNNQFLRWEEVSVNENYPNKAFEIPLNSQAPVVGEIYNGYPSINFGQNQHLTMEAANASVFRRTDQVSLYAVAASTNNGTLFSHGFQDSTQTAIKTDRVLLGDSNDELPYTDIFGPNLSLLSASRNGNQANAFLNGLPNGVGPLAQEGWNGYTFSLGAELNLAGVAQSFFEGDLLEVMVFPFSHDENTRKLYQSYLSLKYGLSPTHELIASDNTLLFDDQSPYANQIAGIGRDDCLGFSQKQSRNRSAESILSISQGGFFDLNTTHPGVFQNDMAYLLWGNDGGEVRLERTLTGNDSVGCLGLDRSWLIREPLADVGEVLVGLPENIEVAYMVISGDPDFSNGDESYVRLANNGQGLLTATYDFAGDQYITFAIEAPTANAGPDLLVCPGNPILLNANEAEAYNWSVLSGSLVLTQAQRESQSPTVNPPDITVIELEITDENGCTARDTLTINTFEVPEVDAGEDREVCEGEEVQLQATGGTQYLWDDSPTLSSTEIENPTANPIVSTTYIVSISVPNGCLLRDSLQVIVNPLPTVDAGENQAICFGDTAQLTATGGDTYFWRLDNTLSAMDISNPLAFPQEETIYYVSTTDANDCSAIDSISVSVNALPQIEIADVDPICAGDSVQLLASGANTYDWQGTNLSSTTEANPFASPTNTQRYLVRGTNIEGCEDTASVLVEVQVGVALTLSADQQICAGDTVQLSAAGGNSYLWTGPNINDPASPTPTVSPEVSSEYTVEVRSQQGCTETATVRVNVNPLPAVEAGEDQAICLGDSTQLTATGGGTYIWRVDNTLSAMDISNPFAFPQEETFYYVRVTDANNCSATDSIRISVNPLPQLLIAEVDPICEGNSVQLVASGANTYEWQGGNLSSTTIANPVATPANSQRYLVRGTSLEGCEDTASVLVEVQVGVALTLSADQQICAGDTVQLSASGGSTYFWEGPYIDDPSSATPRVSPAVSSEYSVEVRSLQGCIETATIRVRVDPKPEITLTDSAGICQGDSVILSASSTPNAQLLWSNGQTTNSVMISPPISERVWAIARSFNGCESDTAFTFVEIAPFPIADFQPDKTVGVEQLEVSFENLSEGASSYRWDFGDRTSSNEPNPQHTFSTSGEFHITLIATNKFGCSDTTTFSSIKVNKIQILLPTAFSPNNDGINDIYTISPEGVSQLTMKVFNRWGTMILEQSGEEIRWDGTHEGKILPEGVFLIKVEGISEAKNRMLETSGFLTIVR